MNASWRHALGVLLLAGLLFFFWRSARLGWLAWQTAETGRQAAAALQSDAGQAPAQLALFASSLDTLNREVQPLAPALRLLANLPDQGRLLAAAPDLTAAAAQLGSHLPWLLGMDAPRTYLVLVQNNHELRATGGFISAFGRLTIAQGRIAALQFVDSYTVFSSQSEYPPAPQPMQDYMGIQLQVARDANWSPDLPTTAAALLPLYTQDTGVTVDGVLTLDIYALKHLVAAMPGLRVEGVNEPLTPENLQAALMALWDQPLAAEAGAGAAAGQEGEGAIEWWLRRKDFIGQVAAAMQQRLPGIGENPADPAVLLGAVWAAFQDRSLQLWVKEPAAQATLAGLGWDGSLRPPAQGDFLAVVDSNLGYNKANAAVERRVDYQVDWSGEAGEVTLTLTYTHGATAGVAHCDGVPRYGDSYADLIDRCYFDYIRVYAPPGSRLRDIRGVRPDSGVSMAAEGGLQQFAGYMILPPNQSKTVTFVYTLPPEITAGSYRLRIQRQSGAPPLPVTVTMHGTTTAAMIAQNVWDWAPGK